MAADAPNPVTRKPGKSEVVATRLGHAEIAKLDAVRGHLTRAQWLRWVVLRALKES